MYEAYALEIIPEERFKNLSVFYEEEQKKLLEEIQAFEKEQKVKKEADKDIEYFYKLVDKYTSFQKLTPKMLNEFVDKILVHKAVKIDGKRTQKVDVHLNYIGKIEFPELEKTEEDIEQEKIDQYWREKYQKSREKELARRKNKTIELSNKFEKLEKIELKRKINEFNNEIEINGLESLPIIPKRL